MTLHWWLAFDRQEKTFFNTLEFKKILTSESPYFEQKLHFFPILFAKDKFGILDKSL